MSRLQAIAEEHWQKYLPVAYASLDDPATFFRAMAEEAESQVQDLAASLRGPDLEAETFAERASRYRVARSTAESTVLRELVLLPEESPELQSDPLDQQIADAMEQFQAAATQFSDQRAERGL